MARRKSEIIFAENSHYKDLDAKFLGRLLKYRREAEKLTQQEAADKIGLSLSYYKSMETGKNNPSIPALYAVLFAYNLSADSILFPEIDDQNNTTLKQIQRLLSRCTENELELCLGILTTILSTQDKIPTQIQGESIGDSYKRAFTEIMSQPKNQR
jgi:transcriptional regulator with XRE-family HTH domain